MQLLRNTTWLSVLKSKWFFYATLGYLLIASIWVALASKYPMAFDENWHMGLIHVYAQYWLPFNIPKTSDMAALGAATSDPSYLFHYFMSFPYRLLRWTGLDETTSIVGLRLINIGLVGWAIVIYRKVMLEARVSRALTHAALAFFTLIPILPLMAGQVNYDNLLLVFTAYLFLYTVRIAHRITKRAELDARHLWLLGIIVLYGSATKYAFLPIVLACVLYLAFLAIRRQVSWRHIVNDTLHLSTASKVVGAMLLVAGMAFLTRDIQNIITYRTVAPPCNYVFSIDECEAYGPWARDYHLADELDPAFHPKNYTLYMIQDWLPGMIMRLFFTVAGPSNDYSTMPPLPVPVILYCVLAAVGMLAFLFNIRCIIRKNHFWLLVITALAIYCAVLSVQVYASYRTTGQPVAINGRYLLPLLPLVIAMCGAGILYIARLRALRIYRTIPTICIALLVLVVLQGGGVGSYIVGSDISWFWPGFGQWSIQILQAIVKPFVWVSDWSVDWHWNF